MLGPRLTAVVLLAVLSMMPAVTPASAATVLASAASEATVRATATSAVPGSYIPVTPSRFVDTRYGTGAPRAQIPAFSTLRLQVSGRAGVPAAGAAAVTMSVNVVNAKASGRLIVYADGTARPDMSSVNFDGSLASTAQVVSRLSGSGKIAIWNSSARPVDIIVDLNGYWVGGAVTAAGGFVPLAPTRSLDTRNGTGASRADWTALIAGFYSTLAWQVTGRGGVPSNAAAVVMAVTATNVTGPGQLVPLDDDPSLTPGVDQAILNADNYFPPATGMAFTAGRPVTNLFIVPLSSSGRARLDLRSDGDSAPGTDVLGDVLGYITAGGATDAGNYQPLPVGALATKVIPGGTTVDLPVPVAGGSTVSVGVTVEASAAAGGVLLYRSGTARPGTRTLSFVSGQRVSGTAMVQTSAAATVSIANLSAKPITISVDLFGYVRAGVQGPTVWSKGSNSAGGMGVGYPSAGSTVPTPVGLTDVRAVTSSAGSSYAIAADGSLWVWGRNSTLDSIFEGGQLGLGDGQDRVLPVRVPSLANVVEVDAAFPSAFALLADGTVRAWGGFADGEVDSPSKVDNLSNVVSIDGDRAVRADGTVWQVSYLASAAPGCAGLDCFTAAQVPGLAGIRQISGEFALRTDGTVERIVGAAPIAFEAGAKIRTLAGQAVLLTDGTVWTLPTNGGNQAVRVPGLTGVTTLGAYAIKADGSVWDLAPAGSHRLTGLPPAVQIPPAPDLIVTR